VPQIFATLVRPADELNSKLPAGLSEGFGLFTRGTGRIGQPVALGGASERADKVLELASGDGEHAGLSRFNPVHRCDVTRSVIHAQAYASCGPPVRMRDALIPVGPKWASPLLDPHI
jgi:hypothetical protein